MHPTTAGPTVSLRLKEATALQHETSEAMLVPYLTAMDSRKQYINLLQVFLGFYAPLEEKIYSLLTPQELPDLEGRGHSGRLRADLQSLQSPVDRGPSTEDSLLPTPHFPLHTPADALGAAYVLEGATLGGKHIRRMLLGRPGLGLSEGELQFFSGYGEATGSRWKAFVAALVRQPDAAPLIRAAGDTFDRFTAWMAQHLNHEETP